MGAPLENWVRPLGERKKDVRKPYWAGISTHVPCQKIPNSREPLIQPKRRRLFASEAGEGRLVLGVDVRGTTTSTAEVASTATLAATLTTSSTAAAAAAAAAASTGTALRLNKSRVEVDGVLDLALTLTLLLAVASGDEVLVLSLLESLGVGPLLVELAALVGPTELEVALEGELLLGLLGEVVSVRKALVLGLGSLLGSGVLGKGLLLLRLGNGFASLLILQLGVTFSGTPGLGSLLLGATTIALLAWFDQV